MNLIRIFDGLYVDQLFQKNERGEAIYYPFGLMGRGYLLPAERAAGVRSATRRLMCFSLIVGFGFAGLAVGFLNAGGSSHAMHVLMSGLAFLAALGLIVHLQLRLAAGLEPAPTPVATGEWLRRGRQARAPWTHWACLGLGVFSLLMAAAGFAFGVLDGELAGIASGGFFLLVGAGLTWDGAMGLIERSRAAKAG